MANKKQRTTGDILLDIEPLILELVDQGLQFGDILSLIHGYLDVHAPNAKEQYVKGGSPVYFYGHRSRLK